MPGGNGSGNYHTFNWAAQIFLFMYAIFFFFLLLKLVLLRNQAQIISKNRDPLTRCFKYANNEPIFDWFIFFLSSIWNNRNDLKETKLDVENTTS